MTLPNLITIGRLILVPLIILMIVGGRWDEAFAIFVVAGVSDGVDGYLAKHHGMASELGAYLDPIADKALIVSIYITLALVGVLPAWLAILVVARDLMIVAAVILSWLMRRPVAIAPFLVSKLNTGAQILLAAVMLGAQAFEVALGPAAGLGQAAVALLTLASMAAYLAHWLRHMAG